MVDRFHEADAANLEKIIHILPAHGKALHDAQHKPQVAADEFLPRRLVACIDFLKIPGELLLGDDGKAGSVDAADFHS